MEGKQGEARGSLGHHLLPAAPPATVAPSQIHCSTPSPATVAPSQIPCSTPSPSPTPASELFSLEAEGSRGEALSHDHSLSNPTPYSFGHSHLSLCRAQAWPAPSLQGPLLEPGRLLPRVASPHSSGRPVIRSAISYRMRPPNVTAPPPRPAGGPECWGVPPTLCSQCQVLAGPPPSLLSAGVLSSSSWDPALLGAGEASLLPPPSMSPHPIG